VSNQNRNDCPTFSGIGVQFKSESVSNVLRILHLPKQDVVGLMIGFRIFPFDGHWMHTGANLTLGKVRDAQSIRPLGALKSVKDEQNLNDDVIFEWRQMVSEMDE